MAAALLAAACSDTDEPVEQQAQPAAEQPATQVQPSQTSQSEQSQPDAPTRAPGDPTRLLVSEAAALEHNGYWEQAFAARQSAIDTAGTLSTDEVASLRLDNIRLLLRLGRPEDARAALDALSGVEIPSDLQRRLLLLQAQAAMALSDSDTAVAVLKSYVNSDSPAWAPISLRIAQLLEEAGRGEEAIHWAERALGGELPLQDELRAIYLAATELDIAGESERAIEHYDALYLRSPWRDDQILALSRSAALQRERGDDEAARIAWQRLVEGYPESELAWHALELLLASDADVDALDVGLIRIAQENWVEARNAMLNLIGGSDDLVDKVAGEYYIAAIHDAQGDADSAVLGYRAVIERDRSDPHAAESAMRLADDALAGGDTASAESYWRLVLTEQPEHAHAAEAGWRLAMSAVSRAEWQTAAERFAEAADLGDGHWSNKERQEFLYWSALMHRQAGQTDRAAEQAQAALEIHPVSFDGLRARTLLGLELPEVLAITTEEWLSRLTGESAPDPYDLEGSPGWLAARDLRLSGFDDAADRVLSHWLSQLGDPWALAQAAEFLDEHGEFSASAEAASSVVDWFGLYWSEAPRTLLQLAYPQPWPGVMALYASSESALDPLLLWSLIRRESYYHADAEGLAGEVGLTQVIPLTGSDIARGLGIEYVHTDLARPELAIRFGAWYLARQLEGFSDDPVMALAAYNAGPGNAARWEDEALFADADGFLAALDFPTTRAYVRYVIEAWAAYRAIAAARP